MIRANDALESDSEIEKRKEAFEMIQKEFDFCSQEDYKLAEGMIETLKENNRVNNI